MPDGEPESYEVAFRLSASDDTAVLTLRRTSDFGGRGALLTVCTATSEWSGLGPDIFSALRSLMLDLERSNGRIGVQGALPHAWASGMQRDMGDGRSVYLLSLPRKSGRPPSIRTLDPAPLDEVGTTVDQDDFQRRWMPAAPGS